MILVTVGTQGAFDRLVDTVDAWAAERGRADVIAQIGPAEREPRHIEWVRNFTPAEFAARLEAASVVVSHAGMGTILTCLKVGKPLLILPRRASLGEQRNEHQLATTKRFAELGAVTPAWDEVELRARLDQVGDLAASARIRPHASDQLIERLRGFFAS